MIQSLPGSPKAWLRPVTMSVPGRASPVISPANPALLPVSNREQGGGGGGAGIA